MLVVVYSFVVVVWCCVLCCLMVVRCRSAFVCAAVCRCACSLVVVLLEMRCPSCGMYRYVPAVVCCVLFGGCCMLLSVGLCALGVVFICMLFGLCRGLFVGNCVLVVGSCF